MSNRDVVLRLIQGINARDQKILEQVYAPECSGNSADGPLQGRAEWMAFHGKYSLAFPDFQFHVNFVAGEGEIVAVHYTFAGTNTHSLAGVPASGRRIFVPGALFSRVQNCRIVEQYFIWDNLGPRRQEWLAAIVEKQFQSVPSIC